MLQTVDHISKMVIIDNSSFGSWMKSKAQSYLSINAQHAVIKKTEGNYHLVEIIKGRLPLLVTALKIVSYLTLILPALALTIEAYFTKKATDSLYYYDCLEHIYFYNNPDCTYSASAVKQALQKNNRAALRALKIFGENVEQVGLQGILGEMQTGASKIVAAHFSQGKEDSQVVEIEVKNYFI